MKNHRKLSAACAGLLALALVAACGQSREFPNQFLTQVPADSPYLLATGADLDPELYQRLMRYYKAIFSEVRNDMDRVVAAMGEDEEPEALESIESVFELAMGMADTERWTMADGAGPDMVVYSWQAFPVLRVETRDSGTLKAELEQAFAELDEALPVLEHAGQEIAAFENEDVGFWLWFGENEFALMLAASAQREAALDHLVGATSPEQSMAGGQRLLEVAEEYGFTDNFIGFADSAALSDMIVTQFFPDLEPACRTQVQTMAGWAPHWASGYREASVNRIETAAIWQLRDDIAAQVKTWAAPVPGMGKEQAPLMTFSLGLDPAAAQTSVRDWGKQAKAGRASSETGGQAACDWFEEVDFTELANAINHPMLAMAGNPKGFHFAVDQAGLGDGSLDLDGHLVLAMDNPAGVASMWRSYAAEFAPESLEVGGPAQPVPTLWSQGVVKQAFAAMSDNAIALAVGDDAANQAVAILEPSPADGLFMEMGYNMPAIKAAMDSITQENVVELMRALGMGDELGELEGEEWDKFTAELESQRRLYAEHAQFSDDAWARVYFTGRGIELRQTVELR